MAKKFQKRNFCMYCGNTNLSKEHIFPRWLQQYIPPPAYRGGHSTSIVRSEGHVEIRFEKENRLGDILNKTVRSVCVTCNNEWMSALQNDAKPLIVDLIQRFHLPNSETERRIIAAWVVMTALSWEQLDKATSTSNIKERSVLKQKIEPPENWFVFIGEFHGDMRSKRIRRRAGLGHRENFPDIVSSHQTTTFAFGKVAFAAYSSNNFTKLEPSDLEQEYGMVCIWPCYSPLLVSTSPLTDLDLDDIAEVVSNYLSPESESLKVLNSAVRLM
ncbi:hypothetical protein [Agrobacterium tumefaciens]|uniref:HNH endonuclease n=1 Tax=Agrobacterium tumefaciens TaxID=358 RepID=A0AAW8LRS0_AGRTU|nr:hypothetical protein [Agrobacterium tumefaciens]MBP2566974.1 hypothetical protein [Agrobacterium tumefaciens]MDR6700566.1 hypothetical protein [Agrobacterium tumefaciens]TCV53036.1 hypothetical protein EDB97_103252 [Agrobacterium tumefaciens]